MRTLLCGICLAWTLGWLASAETPAVVTVTADDPAAIARAYVYMGGLVTLNPLFRLPRAARGPALDAVLPSLLPTTAPAILERVFRVLSCVDTRRPDVIAALRPFLEPKQPLIKQTLGAINALGDDGAPLINELIERLRAGDTFAVLALAGMERHGAEVVPALIAHGARETLGNPAWMLQADLVVPALAAIIATPEPPEADNPYNPGFSVRGGAAYSLSRIGWLAEPALPVLLAALNDDDWKARHGVLEALRSLGPGALPAMPRLIELISIIPPEVTAADKRPGPVRLTELMARNNGLLTIQTMGSMGPLAASAAPALVELALTDDERISRMATSAMEKIGGISANDVARLLAAGEAGGQRGERFFAALRGPSGSGIEALLSRWASADTPLRERLDHGLYQGSTPPAQTPALEQLAHHPDALIRQKILGYLASCRPRPRWIADAIDAGLNSIQPQVVAVSLRALAEDPVRCAARLFELIALTVDSETASSAFMALSMAAPLDEAQIKLLRPFLTDAEPVPHLAAARALATVLTPDEQTAALDCALSAIGTMHPWWQTFVAETVCALPVNPSAGIMLRRLFERSDLNLRTILLRAVIHHLPMAEGTDLLITLLDDPPGKLVLRAGDLLARHGPDAQRALPILRTLAWSSDDQTNQMAWRAIAALDPDDQAAIGHAAAQAWAGARPWDSQSDRAPRLAAIAALTAHPRAVPALVRLGDLLATHVDPEIAAAGRALAERHR